MARDYRKIKAWQLADELALFVYKAMQTPTALPRRSLPLCTGKDSGSCAFRDLRDARERVQAVFIFLKEGLSFGCPDHYVVEGSRRI
jgi:hypothetical protein